MNAILRIEGRSNDLVMLRLLESHCLPILTYGIEIIDIHDRDDKSFELHTTPYSGKSMVTLPSKV